jgi:type IV pilus assembly protein PilA
MFQKLKNKMKDQRGLTLIELLAVIVILAIISAIAIPSILGLINNSKSDAHVANAQQMVNAAKMAIAGNDELRPVGSTDTFITLQYLEDEGYLETLKDPDGTTSTYVRTSGSTVATGTAPSSNSFVKIEATGDKYTYSVFLDGNEKSIGTKDAPIAEGSLKRDIVTKP